MCIYMYMYREKGNVHSYSKAFKIENTQCSTQCHRRNRVIQTMKRKSQRVHKKLSNSKQSLGT